MKNRLDGKKKAEFIVNRRKKLGMTQNDVAERLQVSFQAVSKWENGTIPNVEILVELADILEVSVDEILSGWSDILQMNIVYKTRKDLPCKALYEDKNECSFFWLHLAPCEGDYVINTDNKSVQQVVDEIKCIVDEY